MPKEERARLAVTPPPVVVVVAEKEAAEMEAAGAVADVFSLEEEEAGMVEEDVLAELDSLSSGFVNLEPTEGREAAGPRGGFKAVDNKRNIN